MTLPRLSIDRRGFLILSAALMLRYSLGQGVAADAIEQAVARVLEDGVFTGDIAPEGAPVVNTKGMGQAVVDRLAG